MRPRSIRRRTVRLSITSHRVINPLLSHPTFSTYPVSAGEPDEARLAMQAVMAGKYGEREEREGEEGLL